MENIYFLLCVGVFTASLLFVIWKMERKHRVKLKARNKKKQNEAYLNDLYEPGQGPLIHRHTASMHGTRPSARSSRNQRAANTLRDGTAFAANRLYSDEEEMRDGSTRELTMGVIKYTPEDWPKTLHTRR